MKPKIHIVSKDCIALQVPHGGPDEAHNMVETDALMSHEEAGALAIDILRASLPSSVLAGIAGEILISMVKSKAYDLVEEVCSRAVVEIFEDSGDAEKAASGR